MSCGIIDRVSMWNLAKWKNGKIPDGRHSVWGFTFTNLL